MLEIFKSKEQKKEFVSTYQNPFQSDKIKKIEFTIEKSFFTNNQTKYKSCINFDTGATTGYHRMEANSFPEIVEQTEAFIRSL
jgi:hypothetical protein